MKSVLIVILSLFSAAAFADHGLSLELNRGVGYTFQTGKFWTGINTGGHQAVGSGLTNDQKQFVLNPRVFANWDICKHGPLPLYLGVSWAETVGLGNSTNIARTRVISVPAGMHMRLLPEAEIAVWMNLYADTFATTAGSTTFNETRRGIMEFGGVSGTYFFP